MRLVFTESAWQDYLWFQQQDRKLLRRINALIKETLRSPTEGIGKPERLKANLTGCWSRRINAEHRLVYMTKDNDLIIIACRYHYEA
ncbi:MAG: Txe/YoeB family addiction module toxin [Pirellulales bacterium]|nr:Txe/YoeB family addiction module toxin [Pirellulales bacterium]